MNNSHKQKLNPTDRPDAFLQGQESMTKKWVDMYFKCGACAAVLLAVLEIGFYFLVRDMGLLKITVLIYLEKYVLIPSGLNLAAVGVTCAFLNSGVGLRAKAYVVSLMNVFIIFVIYTIHMQYPSSCIGFAVVMLLTVVYGDRVLTGATCAAVLMSKIISDLFIVWDPSFVRQRLADGESILDFCVSILVLLLTYAACLVVIRIEQEKAAFSMRLEREKMSLYEKMLIDPLTGIQNRNGLRKEFDKMLQDQSGRCYILAMLDIDRFKQLNDTYGHLVGDEYIRALGKTLEAVEEACAFRFGGDEFCLLFCGCGRTRVEERCREVEREFKNSRICRENMPVTLSIGVSMYDRREAPSVLIRRADTAMYHAKSIGETVCFYEETMETETPPTAPPQRESVVVSESSLPCGPIRDPDSGTDQIH